ncbi:MAG TPA: class I SAM-dependent methyltransferase [Spirochaetota bacterium]|nr:class I SAM-dependent methyltransferase [Spirochaetota bacterium]HPI89003.1 class I SAM-dependent methyltransferase [Spirochaetota bacterium]HPR49289.1 class I SAM-dependent methyltransferase [Spirochaetota bacterium]
MERTDDIIKFLEYSSGENIVIEPQQRLNHVRERLFDVIKTYNPKVIVKAGLGNGSLLLDLASSADTYLVVVDYSYENIRRFIEKNKQNSALEKIRFIVGDFSAFPVDYYAADMVASIDYFDFIETAAAIDEFRRALQFEGILFIAEEVLHEKDLDGVYDELMAALFPLHNDYYLESDMKTFLGLNEFKFIKGDVTSFPVDLNAVTEHYAGFGSIDRDYVSNYINENNDALKSLYELSGGSISVPYFIGVFMREKIR